MSGKSFYDLDYIIEVNEQRLLYYTSAYQELMGRLTTIILIYSAMAIFLIPIVRDVVWGVGHWMMELSFVMYAVLFGASVSYTVRFIMPVRLYFLRMPKEYYDDFRLQYEKQCDDQGLIENLLKSTYIHELEDQLNSNDKIFNRKSRFYAHALILGLLSVMPYLVCFGFYISNQKNFTQETAIVKQTRTDL